MATLLHPGDKCAAEVMRHVLTNQCEGDFVELATTGASFAERFKSSADGDDDDTNIGLQPVMAAFHASLRAAPLPTSSAPQTFECVPGDDESEYQAKLYKQVTGRRKHSIVFTPADVYSDNMYKRGGIMAGILQRSKFKESKGEPGKENSLIMLNAELFPNKEVFAKVGSYKNGIPLTETLKDAAKWATSARNNNTICLFTDGRNRLIRKAFEGIVEEAQTDEQKIIKHSILYTPPSKNDPRFATRKTFGALNNRETVTGLLPVPKVRMTSKARTHYSACGEKSTYSPSYTGVMFRRLGRLPRMSLADKEGITGVTLPTYPAALMDALGSKGHPLFLNEIKDVGMYVALYTDLNVTHVLDLAAGSGAAAMAAAILHIQYEGIAMNTNHVNWLERIMDKAVFAILMDNNDEESQKIKGDVSNYFASLIQEAREFLSGDVPDESDLDGDDELDDNE